MVVGEGEGLLVLVPHLPLAKFAKKAERCSERKQ